MPRIAVVTDSVATVPPDLVKKHNIHVAPVHIIWDKVTYRDGVDLTPEQFYRRLRTAKVLPTTSSAVQGEYIQIFEGLRGKVDGAVVIALTGALGASYTSAVNAKELVEGLPVEVIDSRTAMMAQGFAVLAAAKVAAAGGTMSDVVQTVRNMMAKVHIYWAMDTLEYLRRGGRVSLPQAVLAGWLRVKPIMAIKDGKVSPEAKAVTKARAIQKLLQFMTDNTSAGKPLHVAIMHGDVPDELEHVKQAVTTRFQCAELLVSEITPVIGAHIGPGAVGLAFYNE
ncbi:MAG: DegV family protein [Chloroflexi bacterium]|nr:DegV family protein [Chloroflexota bacterium]